MILISLLFAIVQGVYGDDQFVPLRDDFNVPSHCEDMSTDVFSTDTEVFTYGRLGATGKGFTFEYPIERGHAKVLWDYFKAHVKGSSSMALFRKIKNNPLLFRDYKIIMANYAGMGVDFGNEGDVLEVLATYDLRGRFPGNSYFITGGVEYRKGKDSRTIGEIDIMVSSRATCEVLFVGEVKLGTGGALKKARKQLQRFSDFLDQFGKGALGQELDPDDLEICIDPVAA